MGGLQCREVGERRLRVREEEEEDRKRRKTNFFRIYGELVWRNKDRRGCSWDAAKLYCCAIDDETSLADGLC